MASASAAAVPGHNLEVEIQWHASYGYAPQLLDAAHEMARSWIADTVGLEVEDFVYRKTTTAGEIEENRFNFASVLLPAACVLRAVGEFDLKTDTGKVFARAVVPADAQENATADFEGFRVAVEKFEKHVKGLKEKVEQLSNKNAIAEDEHYVEEAEKLEVLQRHREFGLVALRVAGREWNRVFDPEHVFSNEVFVDLMEKFQTLEEEFERLSAAVKRKKPYVTNIAGVETNYVEPETTGVASESEASIPEECGASSLFASATQADLETGAATAAPSCLIDSVQAEEGRRLPATSDTANGSTTATSCNLKSTTGSNSDALGLAPNLGRLRSPTAAGASDLFPEGEEDGFMVPQYDRVVHVSFPREYNAAFRSVTNRNDHDVVKQALREAVGPSADFTYTPISSRVAVAAFWEAAGAQRALRADDKNGCSTGRRFLRVSFAAKHQYDQIVQTVQLSHCDAAKCPYKDVLAKPETWPLAVNAHRLPQSSCIPGAYVREIYTAATHLHQFPSKEAPLPEVPLAAEKKVFPVLSFRPALSDKEREQIIDDCLELDRDEVTKRMKAAGLVPRKNQIREAKVASLLPVALGFAAHPQNRASALRYLAASERNALRQAADTCEDLGRDYCDSAATNAEVEELQQQKKSLLKKAACLNIVWQQLRTEMLSSQRAVGEAEDGGSGGAQN
eukprot:g19457.t1